MASARRQDLPCDRVLHLFLVCLATAGALWVQSATHRLNSSLEAQRADLYRFLTISQGSATWQGHDPRNATARLENMLADRSWAVAFGGLRPRVVVGESGPLLRLVPGEDAGSRSTLGGPGVPR